MLWASFWTGFLTSASLAVAIGPQNAFILRQGIRKEHVFMIALYCSYADLFLMACGVYGLATLSRVIPHIVPLMTWCGFAFLVYYGALSFRRSLNIETLNVTEGPAAPTPLKTIFLSLTAFTFLNPHVYMDTVLLLGSLAQTQPADGRLSFLAGTAGASFVWFFGLAYGAHILTPLFRKPQAWRVLDVLIGLTMWGLAAMLIFRLF